ncbi:TPA: hypothetical protein ACOB6H_002090, partial [Neisseria gonorrhoeae]
KRREEKRRFFAGWIHFRLLIRFNRLKKKIFTDVERRIISGSGRCFNTWHRACCAFYAFGAFGGGKFAYFSRVGRAERAAHCL